MSPDRPSSPRPPEPVDPEASSEGGEEGPASRPTPVRKVMGKGRAAPPEPPSPVRPIEVEGEAWLVREEGRTRSGTRPDAGALLLLLSFARKREPEARIREALAVARGLDDLPDHELLELFRRSRPCRDPRDAPDGGAGPPRRGRRSS